MSSILSGIARTLSGEGATEKPSAHNLFVEGQLIPAVQRVQKELGWRRYKVCIPICGTFLFGCDSSHMTRPIVFYV